VSLQQDTRRHCRGLPRPSEICAVVFRRQPSAADPFEIRYGDAVDVKRAADLYDQGKTLRQIGAELGVP
jgi:hypothetical protein